MTEEELHEQIRGERMATAQFWVRDTFQSFPQNVVSARVFLAYDDGDEGIIDIEIAQQVPERSAGSKWRVWSSAMRILRPLTIGTLAGNLAISCLRGTFSEAAAWAVAFLFALALAWR